MVYPVVIILVILTMTGRLVKSRAIYVGTIIGAMATSLFDALTVAGVPVISVNQLILNIPFAGEGFPWILPALGGGVIGALAARTGAGGKIGPVASSPQ
jgi:LIVCS family branched-chain amino acid:cation transporter